MSSKNRKLRKELAKKKRLEKELALQGKNGTNMSATYLESNNKPNLTTAIRQTNSKYAGYGYDDYYGYTKHFRTCSHYPHKIVTVDNVSIFAASKSQIDFDSIYGIDLIVNCSDQALPKSLTSTTNALHEFNTGSIFESLIGYIKPVRELWLEWDDGSIYPVGLDFWQSMHDIVKSNNYTSLCFACFGGHGRTGTALLSYVIANSNICSGKDESLDDALIKLHEVYCSGAVETWIQEEYLTNLLSYRIEQSKTRPNEPLWEKPIPKPALTTNVSAKPITIESVAIPNAVDTTDTRTEFQLANEQIKAELAALKSKTSLSSQPNPKLWNCPTKDCANKVTYDELYCPACTENRKTNL